MFLGPADHGHQRLSDKSDTRSLRKPVIIARALTIPLSLIGLSLFAAAIPRWDRTFVHHKGPTKGAWQDGMPIAPLVLSFFENTLFYIYALRHRSIHGLVLIALDFLIWALLIPSITFATWGGSFRLWKSPETEPGSDAIFCSAGDAFSKECFPALYTIGTLELVAVVFSCMVWTSHISLFIDSCIEICKYRRAGDISSQRDPRNFAGLDQVDKPSWRGMLSYSRKRPEMSSTTRIVDGYA